MKDSQAAIARPLAASRLEFQPKKAFANRLDLPSGYTIILFRTYIPMLTSGQDKLSTNLCFRFVLIDLSRISFSDLYMLAKRSATADDLSSATEAICNTLAMDRDCSILNRTFSMIELASNVRSLDEYSFCSYELAVTLFIGGLLLWTTHHLRHRQEITASMEWVEQRFGTETHPGLPLASGNATIVYKLQDVVGVLRSIRSVGYASLLASVLEKLQDEEVPGRR